MSRPLPNCNAWFQEADGFPRPIWTYFEQWLVNDVDRGLTHEAWAAFTEEWLRRTQEAAGEKFSFRQSKYIQLLSPHSPRECDRMLEEAERIYSKIAQILGDLILPPFGKVVVLRFRDPAEYYRYISHFHSEDRENPMSGGLCVGGAFPHIVCLAETYEIFRSTFAHELTHLLLRYLPMPAWVHEGVATALEATVGRSHIPNAENTRKQRAYWTEENIQAFWSGETFEHAGESFELGYGLAAIIFDVISKELQPPPSAFRQFIQHAHRDDGGADAAVKHLRAELGELLEVFLGPGNWNPRPKTWAPVIDPSSGPNP